MTLLVLLIKMAIDSLLWIIYIMGTGRSGSTLLGAMIASCLKLSSIHVGELNWYFNYNGLKPHLRTDWEKSVQEFYDSLGFELNKSQDLVKEERYKACILYLLGREGAIKALPCIYKPCLIGFTRNLARQLLLIALNTR